jgi:hypothetical protein
LETPIVRKQGRSHRPNRMGSVWFERHSKPYSQPTEPRKTYYPTAAKRVSLLPLKCQLDLPSLGRSPKAGERAGVTSFG